MLSDVLDWAWGYRGLGWAPIPLNRASKTPNLSTLAPFLEGAISENRLRMYDWQGIGLVTGRLSNIVVLDADGTAGKEELSRRGHPVTPMARTGDGLHLYFRYSKECEGTSVRFAPGLDLKSNRGYVVAPPSLHPNGVAYEWLEGLSPWDVPVAELPPWVLGALKNRVQKKVEIEEQLAEPIRDGGRNDALTQVAGALRRRGLPYEDLYVVLQSLNEIRCDPPLPREEVARIANNISSYAAGKYREKRNSPQGTPQVTINVMNFGAEDEPPVF